MPGQSEHPAANKCVERQQHPKERQAFLLSKTAPFISPGYIVQLSRVIRRLYRHSVAQRECLFPPRAQKSNCSGQTARYVSLFVSGGSSPIKVQRRSTVIRAIFTRQTRPLGLLARLKASSFCRSYQTLLYGPQPPPPPPPVDGAENEMYSGSATDGAPHPPPPADGAAEILMYSGSATGGAPHPPDGAAEILNSGCAAGGGPHPPPPLSFIAFGADCLDAMGAAAGSIAARAWTASRGDDGVSAFSRPQTGHRTSAQNCGSAETHSAGSEQRPGVRGRVTKIGTRRGKSAERWSKPIRTPVRLGNRDLHAEERELPWSAAAAAAAAVSPAAAAAAAAAAGSLHGCHPLPALPRTAHSPARRAVAASAALIMKQRALDAPEDTPNPARTQHITFSVGGLQGKGRCGPPAGPPPPPAFAMGRLSCGWEAQPRAHRSSGAPGLRAASTPS